MNDISNILGKIPSPEEQLARAEAFERYRAERKAEAERIVARVNAKRRSPEWQLKALISAGVPKRFLQAKVSDFPTHVFLGLRSHWHKGGSALVTGQTGTGKTHLAVALMRSKLEFDEAKIVDGGGDYQIVEPRLPKFVTSPSLLVEIRGTFGHSDETKAVIDSYLTADSMVLDDLGAEKQTDWSMEVLYLIIDSRYSQMKQLLVTSNLSVDEIAARLGDRIASRLSGLGFVLHLEGRDRRLTE